MPRAGSDLFAFTIDELTVGRSDFTAGSIGVDLAIMIGDRADFVLGLTSDQSTTHSEFRDWVDNNEMPIEQETRFRRVPLVAGVRYNLAPRGRRIGSYAWIPARIVPFVGAGVGIMRYEFEQAGDFIDMTTLDVFSDRFVERGWSPLVQGSLGATVNVNPFLQVVGELRYVGAQGRADSDQGDFQGFGRLDLSGASTLLGLSFRF